MCAREAELSSGRPKLNSFYEGLIVKRYQFSIACVSRETQSEKPFITADDANEGSLRLHYYMRTIFDSAEGQIFVDFTSKLSRNLVRALYCTHIVCKNCKKNHVEANEVPFY